MSWLLAATLAAIGVVALTCMALVWAALVRSSQISEQERRMERRLQRYVERHERRRDASSSVSDDTHLNGKPAAQNGKKRPFYEAEGKLAACGGPESRECGRYEHLAPQTTCESYECRTDVLVCGYDWRNVRSVRQR